MKSLHQVIIEKGSEYESEKIATNIIVLVDGEARILSGILDKVAVVHPLRDSSPQAKIVCRLEKVMVWPQDIKWERRID